MRDLTTKVGVWWGVKGLCLHLQVPFHVEQEIRQQTTDATEQKQKLLKRWLSDHPTPSWELVTEALYQMEEHDILKEVKEFIQKIIIPGMFGW